MELDADGPIQLLMSQTPEPGAGDWDYLVSKIYDGTVCRHFYEKWTRMVMDRRMCGKKKIAWE